MNCDFACTLGMFNFGAKLRLPPFDLEASQVFLIYRAKILRLQKWELSLKNKRYT